MATQTTYTDASGKKKTGYIINGKTYQDAAGTQRIAAGSTVTTAGGQYRLNADGTSTKVDPTSSTNASRPSGTQTYSGGSSNRQTNATGGTVTYKNGQNVTSNTGSGGNFSNVANAVISASGNTTDRLISDAQKYAQNAAPGNQTAATTSVEQQTGNKYYAPMAPGFQGSTSVASGANISGEAADIIGKMNANSVAWHSAPDGSAEVVGTKGWRSAQNQSLAQTLRDLGYNVEQGNGTWIISGGANPVDEAMLEAAEWQRQYEELLARDPRTDQSYYTNQALTYDEAMALAQQYYDRMYGGVTSEAQRQAAANLDRMGIYNSVYGQNLLASAVQAEENAKADQVIQLAMEMVGKDRDYYTNLLSLAQNDNQNAANYYLDVQNSGMDAGLAYAQTVIDRLNADREYELARQAQAVEIQYQQGLINQMQLENRLLELELAGGYRYGGGGGGGGYTASGNYTGNNNAGGFYGDNQTSGGKSFKDRNSAGSGTGTGSPGGADAATLAAFDQIWQEVFNYGVTNLNGADARAYEAYFSDPNHDINSFYTTYDPEVYENAVDDFTRVATVRGYNPDWIRSYAANMLQTWAGYSERDAQIAAGIASPDSVWGRDYEDGMYKTDKELINRADEIERIRTSREYKELMEQYSAAVAANRADLANSLMDAINRLLDKTAESIPDYPVYPVESGNISTLLNDTYSAIPDYPLYPIDGMNTGGLIDETRRFAEERYGAR